MKGIIKNYKKVHSIYKKTSLSLEDRFVTHENKSIEWVEKLEQAAQMDGLFGLFRFIKVKGFSKLDVFWGDILAFIDTFTLEETTDEEITKEIAWLKKKYRFRIKDIIIAEEGNQLIFKLTGRKDFKATKLSFLIPEIKELLHDIENKQRHGRCHWASIRTAFVYNDISVVTGETWITADKAKYLHSWIEQELDGFTICADATRNVVMRKEYYYKMFHVTPLEKISSEQIRKDYPIIAPLTSLDSNYTKLYLSSREEALEIAEKFEKEGKIERKQTKEK